MNGSICLNADLGELPGRAGRDLDAALLALVSRCNIACGGHAGDPESMAATVDAAARRDVGIGAHPSYPDRAGFGRQSMAISRSALADSLSAQVTALVSIATAQGSRVRHLKPHGALYNDAAADPALAMLVARLAIDARIGELLGPPRSALAEAAAHTGLRFVAEGFADRAYQADGGLAPRNLPGAVLGRPAALIAQALQIVRTHTVTARTGELLELHVQTLCLHGDTPAALSLARALRDALDQAGIAVRAGE
ncbi:MAG: 5-oxoprolinase subunit PxpA [Xanthomonadales bacterium]|nr:5-oxoprolinase subunit PxpA [Xanthomonadales bacterium]